MSWRSISLQNPVKTTRVFIYNFLCVKEIDSMASRDEIADINNIKDVENGDINDNQFDKNKFQQG